MAICECGAEVFIKKSGECQRCYNRRWKREHPPGQWQGKAPKVERVRVARPAECAWCHEGIDRAARPWSAYCSDLCQNRTKHGVTAPTPARLAEVGVTVDGVFMANPPGRVENECKGCGRRFRCRRARSYCTMECYYVAIGSTPEESYWVNLRTRLAVYHRDGYRCQLCFEPVDMCADPGRDPRGPSLDHIIPRARGGGDERSNLRLAHRGCNSRRGSAVEEFHVVGRVRLPGRPG